MNKINENCVIAMNLGFPRMGPNRELKKVVEGYWKGEKSAAELAWACVDLRKLRWETQVRLGVTCPPSNDFSLYDHVLDMTVMVGAIPQRFAVEPEGPVDLATYFLMARGGDRYGRAVGGLQMRKWFDTNYHYLVPEFEPETTFSLRSLKPVDEFEEALRLGIKTRPVLLGPVSFLRLGKGKQGVKPLELLDGLVEVYKDLLTRLAKAGAEWVQMDEPILSLDLDRETQKALKRAYTRLARVSGIKILVANYFGELGDNLATAVKLPVTGLHVDLVRATQELGAILQAWPTGKTLSLGLVDGRNVWKTDLERAITLGKQAVAKLGSEYVHIAPSCSLLHVPWSLEREMELDAEVRSSLAFATEKLSEVSLVSRALREGRAAVAKELAANAAALEARRSSTRIHRATVQARLACIKPNHLVRHSPYATRSIAQAQVLKLPLLPTTTIGSLPQTDELRQMRAKWRANQIRRRDYEDFVWEAIKDAVEWQDKAGMDVIVHGEFERDDMVDYFGQRLSGFAFTRHGWVQSFGTRCVRPPIIYGDVERPRAMTVEHSRFAQMCTQKPVKGMLTGPVTMLKWSFVRDDQPLEQTCRQIAIALRDEVLELEAAGIKIIQIDEPALREGLPLRKRDHATYLRWAVDAFRLTAGGVRDETQVHTHMCYADFAAIIGAVIELDADVISIETARTRMEDLAAFVQAGYPSEVGPGVYDIHSPRVPTVEEMTELIRAALQFIAAERLWVNPDCGLKTRRWEEVHPALRNMVEAAKRVRQTLPR